MVVVNCTPQSEVMAEGIPKRLTHPVKNASAHASVEVPERVTAFAHLTLLSTVVKRCEKPPLTTGSSPTRSMWTWKRGLASQLVAPVC
jgi:hypothetical protein